ncbi:hypothetical protein LCGC14_2562280 [marine sediment metagenome]|uniref:DUF6362 domain-containing protein n=1 Tax=marine sediment metagenome TaxID=412755 RepID=A0A0F9CVZ5_9ZZZZ
MKNFGELSFAEAIALIEARLRMAAKTLELIRRERHSLPDKMRAQWPDVVHDWLAYDGAWAKDRQRDAANSPAIPPPDDIDRMDQALQWLLWVPELSRRVLFSRAVGVSWRALAAEVGLPVIEVRTRHKLALEAILTRIIEESSKKMVALRRF